jgi:PKD repeat protein
MKFLSTRILLFAFLLLGCIVSCRKTQKTTLIYTFSYTGSPYVWDTISFMSTAPSGSTFLWNFGDSTNSVASNPDHIYSKTGTMIVSLIVNNDTAHTIKDTLIIGPKYMGMVAGTRLCHHTYIRPIFNVLKNYFYDTTIVGPDISLGINYVSPISVAIGSEILVYTSGSSSDSVLVFSV